MQSELIKLTIQPNGEQAVSARELHSFLEIETQFSKWAERMFEYGFVENQDYSAISQKRLTAQGNITTYTDYALTLDTAKEIAMLQRSDKGKQARQFFIECEKRLRQVAQPAGIPTSFADALRLAADMHERVTAAQIKIEQLQPKATYADTVLSAENTVTTTVIAKELGMSAITLNRLLSQERVQHNIGGTWVLYQKYQADGYTKTRTEIYFDSDGNIKTKHLTVWTEKGRQFIHKLMAKIASRSEQNHNQYE